MSETSDDQPVSTDEPTSGVLRKEDWAKVGCSAALIIFGLMFSCFVGGATMFGYINSRPEGLIASNRQLFISFAIGEAIGLALIIFGFWRIRNVHRLK